jgi:hypothetical protein
MSNKSKLMLPAEMIQDLLSVKKILDSNKINNTIIGGIAVGLHSRPRTTEDVDFAILEKDENKVKRLFPNYSLLELSKRHGFTIKYNNTDVDFLVLDSGEDFILQNKETHPELKGIDLISAYDLIYMKIGPEARSKDSSDVIEIIKTFDSGKMNGFIDYLKSKLSYLDKYEKEKLFEEISEEYNSLCNIAMLEKYKKKNSAQEFRKFLLLKIAKSNV